MAADFCAAFATSRDVFTEASDALGLDVAALCAGSDGRLELTEYAQPAILTAEIAIFRALREQYGFHAEYFGGHSLGEYSALCAAGVIPLADAVRVVRNRGAAMQRAVAKGSGGMLAVSGPRAASRVSPASAARFELDIASVNSPDQIVLSGLLPDLARAEPELASAGYELARLDVSAPFHSRYMRAIEPVLRRELELTQALWEPGPAPRVVSNALAEFHLPDTPSIIGAHVSQLSSQVRWLENMSQLAEKTQRIVEIGPSRPLRGLFRSLGVTVASISSLRTAERELCA
jgi:[acyl-carrier-protein] S-malonyltransferase/trans-AT polyketide synthase/acyltransferase/oxidoreductase domain-containing protein